MAVAAGCLPGGVRGGGGRGQRAHAGRLRRQDPAGAAAPGETRRAASRLPEGHYGGGAQGVVRVLRRTGRQEQDLPPHLHRLEEIPRHLAPVVQGGGIGVHEFSLLLPPRQETLIGKLKGIYIIKNTVSADKRRWVRRDERRFRTGYGPGVICIHHNFKSAFICGKKLSFIT